MESADHQFRAGNLLCTASEVLGVSARAILSGTEETAYGTEGGAEEQTYGKSEDSERVSFCLIYSTGIQVMI